ncbi:hypothetical protein NIES4075_58140 [Tolypothrix sp. NIES-4075]|nr:hypothetical protein NIES4075_58140 [Tolypothrix sp. NIES-4075]
MHPLCCNEAFTKHAGIPKRILKVKTNTQMSFVSAAIAATYPSGSAKQYSTDIIDTFTRIL